MTAEAERDAALAAIERIRAIHERDMVLRDYCSECSDFGSDQFPPGQMVEWPCPTIQALDGAPEPEGRWEYGTAHTFDPGVGVAESSQLASKIRVDAWNEATRTNTGIVVRRRKAGPWLPVEGEKP